MLESFPVESSITPLKKQPVKLEGFASEIPLTTYTTENHRQPRIQLEAPIPLKAPAPAPAPVTVVRNVRPEPPTAQVARRKISSPRMAGVAALALALIVVAGWRLTPVAELRQGDQRRVDVVLPPQPLARVQSQPQAQPPAVAPAPSQPIPSSQVAAAPEIKPQAPPSIAKSVSVAAAKPAATPVFAAANVASPTPTPARRVYTQERVATSGRIPATIASFTARPTPATTQSAPVELPRATLPTTIAMSDASTLRGEHNAATAATSGTTEPVQLPSQRLDVRVGAVGATADDRAAIQDVIRRYETAYERLDAAAAKQIWPTVDERALAKAFSGLASQTLTLQPCRIDVGNSSAVASCPGSATYVARVGGKSGQIQRRDWTFVLRKANDGWQIGSVQSN